MTVQSEIEMLKMQHKVDSNHHNAIIEDLRERLMEITNILETVDKAYNDGSDDNVTYKHSELWRDAEDMPGWAYTAWSIASKVKYNGQ